jgi:Flp pilus assembly protein TadD
LALAALLLASAPAFGGGPERWVEVTSPNFVVVSNAGQNDAKQMAVQFEQIRSLFREALPLAKNHNGPIVTILAAKNEKTLQELLPEYWAKGHAHPAGIFVQALNQFYIAIEMDAQGPNPYETIYHEYYHSLTIPYAPNTPTWLAEGLADFFGNSEIDGKTAVIGEASAPLLYQLQGQQLIRLSTLFHVNQSSPYYNENSKVTLFYAESWALVHYLVIGDNEAHKPMLTAYLNALGNGATEDQAAATAFGNLDKLQHALQDYIRRNSYYHFRLDAPERVSESDLRVRQLSESDVDAYKGGFAETRGHAEEAKTELAQAIQLDPKNPISQANMAIAEFFLGEKSEALDAASKAVALDPNNAVTRYLRAYLAYNTVPGARNLQVEDDLRAAIAISPEFAPPYGLMAFYLATQNGDLTEALTDAQRAISIEPGNSEYRLAEAQVLARMQNFAAAQKALQFARETASTSQQSLRVEMFASGLEEMEKYAAAAGTRASADAAAETMQSSQAAGDLQRRDETPAGTGASMDINVLDATGTVSDVTCANGLKLQLSTTNGSVQLRNAPGGTVRIESTSAIPQDLTPCGLKGRRIKVRYIADGSNAHTGILEVIQLLDAKP